MDFSVLKQLVEINSWTKNKVGVDLNGEIMKSLYRDIGYQISEYKREDIGNHLWIEPTFLGFARKQLDLKIKEYTDLSERINSVIEGLKKLTVKN